VDRLIDHPSRTRNEVIADLMRKLNFAEERGSGIDKAVIASEIFGLPPIKFIDGKNYFKVVLFARKRFSSMTKEELLDTIYQHTCLNAVIQKRTTAKTLKERFKFTKNDSTRIYKLVNEAVNNNTIKIGNPSAARKDQFYLPYWG
jgi:ATP-dependent DNA helicase RecG